MPDKCQIVSSFSVGSTHKHGILCENIAILFVRYGLIFVRCLWFGFPSFKFICFSCDSIRICVDWKQAQSSVLYVVLYKCLTFYRFAILYFIRCRFFLLRFQLEWISALLSVCSISSQYINTFKLKKFSATHWWVSIA